MGIGPTAHEAERTSWVIWEVSEPVLLKFCWRHQFGQRESCHSRWLLVNSRFLPNNYTTQVYILIFDLISEEGEARLVAAARIFGGVEAAADLAPWGWRTSS